MVLAPISRWMLFGLLLAITELQQTIARRLMLQPVVISFGKVEAVALST